MYLMTAFGILDNFYTWINKNLFQGLIQENRAASPSFLLITIILVYLLY